jgi:hypothetical protein
MRKITKGKKKGKIKEKENSKQIGKEARCKASFHFPSYN